MEVSASQLDPISHRICVCVCVHVLSHVQLFATLWIVSHHVPVSVEFPKQGYWSGLQFPAPEDLPNPGIKPTSPVSPALADGFLTTSATCKAQVIEWTD